MMSPFHIKMMELSLEEAKVITDCLNEHGPHVAKALLVGGLMGIMLLHISDDDWRLLMAVRHQPCGRPGCECEQHSAPLMDVLDTVRDRAAELRDEMNQGGAQ